MPETLLVSDKEYRRYGAIIGTRRNRSYEMRKFIYRIRRDGLAIIDMRKIDERIRLAARMIARYEPDTVAYIGARYYASKPIEMIAEVTGGRAFTGRFFPGTFTNPNSPSYFEPEIVVINDTHYDRQAVKESVEIGVPIVAFCDTHNNTNFVDLIIPANNRGRPALGFLYWLLAREILKARGTISSDEEFQYSPEDFMVKI
ncbi:MAG TPA: 30S ribosomal protein S2 [Thermoprotei archaeon]|nr:30S ribosomal protein S2 [Euryarchaeota archaeon]MCD6158221.1 30S ribosomal protein S2 [Euryarchaeota archaeon]HDJ50956.1 30S ribosomal protein S2 [Thermoprotei archaeon]